MAGTLRLILGDQLSLGISSLTDADTSADTVLIAEVSGEATYVRHHKKKIAFLFSAMRHFAEELRGEGFRVRYTRISDEKNAGSLRKEVERALDVGDFDRIVVTKPGEFRLLKDMQQWESAFGVPVELREDDRFICSVDEFATWAEGRKSLRMEFFYREMRKKTGLLMDGDEPEGGEWNFDQDNRKSLPKSVTPPPRATSEPDGITLEAIEDVRARFDNHFGDLEPFFYATTRAEAERVFEVFASDILPGFGDYQDAMAAGEPWLWHGIIGLYLNCGLLDPLRVCQRAERAYRDGHAPLNAVEGFIRQIIGWREYVRGLYWLKMPEYRNLNALEADRKLPDFYWTAETDMKCMAEAIGQTKRHAYAHHIQRLMVTGNFALLAGIHPDEINEWYLVVYADAYEWVELPNTHGMAIFADGGIMASKPYAASANYINKMSDYCKSCRYSHTKKTGHDACPFNFLYWDFLARNKERLAGNGRMGLVYKNLEKKDDSELSAMRAQAKEFLESIGAVQRD
jgi:deoxyribodipyrimidine photolyase-related protein